MTRTLRVMLIAAILLTIAIAARGSVLTATGYTCTDTVITMPDWAFLGGFDMLPDGSFVVNDGYTIREVSTSGKNLKTFFTFPTPVMGSFVRCNCNKLYFGESTMGSSKIYSMALRPLRRDNPVTCLTSLPNNFDMDFRGQKPYVVADDTIYLLNDDNTTTPVVKVPGYSGPLAFDCNGDLFYAPSLFPSSTSILKWDRRDVNRAPRLGVLSPADADVLAPIGAAYGFAFDGCNRLLFTDNSGVTPKLVRFDGRTMTTLATFSLPGANYPAMTFVRTDGDEIYVGVTYFNADFSGSSTFITTLREIKRPRGCR